MPWHIRIASLEQLRATVASRLIAKARRRCRFDRRGTARSPRRSFLFPRKDRTAVQSHRQGWEGTSPTATTHQHNNPATTTTTTTTHSPLHSSCASSSSASGRASSRRRIATSPPSTCGGSTTRRSGCATSPRLVASSVTSFVSFHHSFLNASCLGCGPRTDRRHRRAAPRRGRRRRSRRGSERCGGGARHRQPRPRGDGRQPQHSGR